jgi:hypothetical protein
MKIFCPNEENRILNKMIDFIFVSFKDLNSIIIKKINAV